MSTVNVQLMGSLAAQVDYKNLENGEWSDPVGQEALLNAAHALRTPLSSIKGYSSTLLQTDVEWSPEMHQEFIETIDREADVLSRAINDLLGSIELESNGVHLDRSEVSVESLFDMAKSALASDSLHRFVEFVCEPDLPPVLVDQTRIIQVIVYLTRCAERVAAPGASLRLKAYVDTQRRPSIVITEVNAGTAPDVTWQARGYRPVENVNGLLGWVDNDLMLSVCGTLLSAHGVDLQMRTNELEDDLFWFELPIHASQYLGAVIGP